MKRLLSAALAAVMCFGTASAAFAENVSAAEPQMLLSETLSDDCESFENVYSYSNLAVGYFNDKYHDAFSDLSVWRTADKTKPAEVVYRAAEGLTLRSIKLEISRQNKIFYPKVEWSEDGVNYIAVTEEQSEKKYDVSDYGSGILLQDSDYNTWHKKYTLDKYLAEKARFVRISLPSNAIDKEECFYIRKVELDVMPRVEYKTSLKTEFEEYFDISTAIEPVHTEQFPDMLSSQFSVLVSENAFKPWIHSGENTWQWKNPDKIVDFAVKNGLKVRAHTLVSPVFFDSYAGDQSKWWYYDEDGNSLFNADGTAVEGAKELTLKRLENHVKTIVSRYKGKVYAYDVVNEAYKTEDGDGYMRDYTKFWKLLGRRDDSWINKCFEWAHEADPDAVLIYNDNGFTSDKKHQDLVYDKIKEMRDAGIPACVGMQMHYDVNVSLEDVDALLKRFSGLCDIYVTELDMAIGYQNESLNSTTVTDGIEKANVASGYYPEYMTEEVKALWAKKYASLFDLFRKYSDSIECVGFWGVYNGQTEAMKKGSRILFGENAEPNEGYDAAIDSRKTLPRWEAGDKLPKVRFIDYETNSESNTVTLYTDKTADGSVTASIYTPSEDGSVEYFGKKFTLSDTKTTAAKGRQGITLSLGKAAAVPEDRDDSVYVISIAESGKETVWDYFCYNVGGDGVIIDEFNDYEKMYALNQMTKSSNITRYGDWFGMIPQAPIQRDKDRYLIYKMPSGKEADKLTLDFWIYDYNGTVGKYKPQISASADGIDFDTVISAQTSVTSSKADNRIRKQTVTQTIPSGMKYIKVDLNEFPESWIVYLEGLKIETRALSQGREYVLNVDADGKASAAAYGGDADEGVSLVIAEYRADGTLKGAQSFTVDLDSEGNCVKREFEGGKTESDGYFRVYLFENTETLRPLV